MNDWLPKLLLSAGCLAVVLFRIAYPDIKIDGVTFGLLVLAVLPWLSSLIKSFELPGGWRIEFQDVQKAGADIIAAGSSKGVKGRSSHPSFLDIVGLDPSLALVAMRIELEKRIRALAMKRNIPEARPLGFLIQELFRQEVLPYEAVKGLRELVAAGNSAAHGGRVEPSVTEWAMSQAPEILGILDGMIDQQS
jgi:hypothetical protein